MPGTTVLAGGVGAARLLRGLVDVVPPDRITAVLNTGDDLVLHGLEISPDLDTVLYTLAGAVNPETGWGLAGETWRAMEALERFGGQTWFRLGDADLATHLYRTQRRQEGAPLSQVTAELAAAWGVGVRLLPATDDRLATRLTLARDGKEVAFQHYFVALRHEVAVASVRFDGAAEARPGPGVLAAISDAEAVVIAPSNPIVSIGPILAVPGIRAALEARRADVVAVSPIVAGAALKGPADRLMAAAGIEVSCAGVASIYADICGTLLVDETDADRAGDVERHGVRAAVAPILMRDAEGAERLARRALDLVG